jgi:mono/diheme cytochrome c family protein
MNRLLLPAAAFSVLWAAALLTGAPGATRAAAPADPATFSNQVVRIFQRSCQSCHHEGDIAPFPLMTYEESAPYAELIKERTASREMPPWKPVAGCGEFQDTRRLTDDEIATLAAWADAGAPEGDASDLPEELDFPDGWKLGEPDVMLANAPNGYKVPLDGSSDVYRNFSVPAPFDADRYITGVEVRPGNREIVHHVLIFIDTSGQSVTLDRDDPGPGYASSGGGIGFLPDGSLGGWAPGASPQVAPAGIGTRVPAGARLVIQIHYSLTNTHDHGKEGAHRDDVVDRTLVGLHFARTPVRKDLHFLPLVNFWFTIPAGAPRHEVTATFVVPPGLDATLHAIAPHMHLLGREMRVEATYPSGETACLVDIEDWDFHWQGAYLYEQPVPLPAGTWIQLRAIYDNSTDNPLNPHSPPVDVRWGEETGDEMCLCFLAYTLDAQELDVSSPAILGVEIKGRKLLVSGSDLLEGALIEVDGSALRDSRAARGRVASKAAWRQAVPEGATVQVTVLNPDGARSEPFEFTR